MRFRWLYGAVALVLLISAPAAAQDDLEMPIVVSEVSTDQQGPRLKYDDGTMEDRLALDLSGSTVEFAAPAGEELIGVQFYGALYSRDEDPGGTFTVTISDESFKSIRRIDKPLATLTPGRETWQSVNISPPLPVSGRFYVTLIYNSTSKLGIYIGVDEDNPTGYSKIGVPGTVATDVDSPYNWMIRAITAKPGDVGKVVTTLMPAPTGNRAGNPLEGNRPRVEGVQPSPVTPAPNLDSSVSGTARPGVGTVPTDSSPVTTAGPSSSKLAYRDPHRKLSIVSVAPRIPKGSGRVDVSWNVPAPVTVELNYVGKPAKVLSDLRVQRLAVDFPVPEPGLFNVVIKKPGFISASKQFRVVSGGRDEWRVTMVPGQDAPQPAPEVIRPVIEDVTDGPPTGIGPQPAGPSAPAPSIPNVRPRGPQPGTPGDQPGGPDGERPNMRPRSPRPSDAGDPGAANDGESDRRSRRPRVNINPAEDGAPPPPMPQPPPGEPERAGEDETLDPNGPPPVDFGDGNP